MFNNDDAIYVVSKFRMDDTILTPKRVALILHLF